MRTARTTALTTAALALLAPPALGAPPLGGEMDHMLVELMPDDSFDLAFERPLLLVMQGPASGYTGAEAVLNGASFNGQYGWLVSGFWAPPAGGQVWIESIDQDPRVSVYCGRAMPGVAYFQPLFGTDGSGPLMPWDGSMLHNYYAVETLGVFHATYRVYIGDGAGTPMPAYTPGEITLQWQCGHFDIDGDEAFTRADLEAWAAAADGDVNQDGAADDADLALLIHEHNRVVTGCPADLAGAGGLPDGTVNLDDLDAFVGAFLAGAPLADLTGDGIINLDDLDAYIGAFLAGCA